MKAMTQLRDDELVAAYREARAHLTPETFDAASDIAFEVARRNGERRDAAHAAYHRVDCLRYGTVERRRGYRGQTVCLDCYRGREWDGRYEELRPGLEEA